MTRNGRVRYELKTPWRNGTTHVKFEPSDFMYRMYGMPRAQGCAGAAMYRMYGMPLRIY
jgi:Putative transposase